MVSIMIARASAASVPRPRIPRRKLLPVKIALAERFLSRMVRSHVRHVRLVVRHADDATDHGRHAPRDAGGEPGVGWRNSGVISHGLALLPLGPMVRSYKLKMRVYSSVKLAGRTNPWFSTG